MQTEFNQGDLVHEEPGSPFCPNINRRHSFPNYLVTEPSESESEEGTWQEDPISFEPTPTIEVLQETNFQQLVWYKLTHNQDILHIQESSDFLKVFLEMYSEAIYESTELYDFLVTSIPSIQEMGLYLPSVGKNLEELCLFKVLLDVHEYYLLSSEYPLYTVYQSSFLELAKAFYQEYYEHVPFVEECLREMVEALSLVPVVKLDTHPELYVYKQKHYLQETVGVKQQHFYL
mmetsp:Transcript_6636/g.9807  ORF Transcript_6636/g.9807 Transcript_6636/m.9807 type:complete len:232 (+) Transcript_6636:20-715(+)